ncbi:Hypothetical protein R9X50_00415800 [Acrodontium crateriforme]|uniref:Glucose-methanol-choline oxidoreductase N-terminal domain-containing protein n=1 Tax=Acrodontium crateriforme TaxID=150365 RepID=A0AAQ3R852_9PEZI|nr:Hypothetical protein R9X50_00415800 [Acrodontium crateriforme]
MKAIISALIGLSTIARAVPQSCPDYAIVGGGPSGFVLAEHLSRDPTVSVVLLEAGPDNIGVEDIDIPGHVPFLYPTLHSWNFTSQPDPNLDGATPGLAIGRGFGGGSAINYMLGCRGAPSVFDEWAKISGDDGLKWKNFEQDFKATTHYTKQSDVTYDTHLTESAYGDGPVELTAPTDLLGAQLQFVNASQRALNIPWVDLSDGHGIGVTIPASPIRASNRTRDFASQAYGWPMGGRPNVQLMHDTEVIKVGFKGRRATDVTYINHVTGAIVKLRAKEIILSAGTINSPKLLMLSGVGPAKQLKKLGIPLIKDIPELGQNLLDHHVAYTEFEVVPSVETLWQWAANATGAAIANREYAEKRRGPLSVDTGQAFSIIRAPDSVFKKANASPYYPNLPADRGHILMQFSSGAYRQPSPNISLISPFVAVVQPEESGYMQLASKDYRDSPIIHSNYYGSAGDKAAVLWGVKQIRKVMADAAFSPLVVREFYPGAEVQSDEDLWHSIRNGSASFNHPMGTAALGTVIEGKTYRVKGLDGIRVVDASNFPVMVTCQPMMTVYAHAHHAAQLISKQDRKS